MTVVFYDGECRFCSAVVIFVLRRDRDALFQFASIQSEAGCELLAEYGVPSPRLDTMYLLEAGQVYERSTAALRIARRLRGYGVAARICLWIPRFLRDFCYRVIARNRHRILRENHCFLPNKDEEKRFLGL
ncbi:MAG TPA: thiol-disulfide oxidoreductase DCC family protein [Verrucomicrobiales bacterium]|nr:thiol-disulfide oxidoreductase DCC family protein [Verrucomicrobiales bacterium]